ncbi:MAG: HAD-IC family P-type ATPase [Lachnospiraceae bacterium]|nr:HAD-IC family P-type ATPase [Lachnospiraceae bacterium]
MSKWNPERDDKEFENETVWSAAEVEASKVASAEPAGEPDAAEELEMKPEAEMKAEVETKTEANAEPETAMKAEDEMKTEVETKTEANAEPETAIKSEVETEPAQADEEPLEEMRPFTRGEGLTMAQVRSRAAAGKVNTPVDAHSVTMRDIVIENVCTYFNLIFLLIAICLCVVGSYRDLTFLPIIIINTLIGIFQESRSKKLLDKLSFVSAPKIRVWRDGELVTELSQNLVQDDLILLEAGSQICADAVVEEGEVQVNESLLTGEADEILHREGETLLSGSFVVAGSCRARLTRVGEESYVSKLTLEAKARKKGEQSEMIRSLDRLVKIVGIAIIPITALLVVQQYVLQHMSLRFTVTRTAAAVLGMIPEGLYLLASVAMAVSALRLAMGKVLVHNMKSIETLARADVLCVDKTGTITENRMTVKKLVPFLTDEERKQFTGEKLSADQDLEDLPEYQELLAQKAAALELRVGDFAACMNAENATMKALKEFFGRQTGRRPDRVIPFTSATKYSGAVFGERAFILGAPEFVLKEDYPVYQSRIEAYSRLGYRVLVFGEYDRELSGGALEAPIQAMGMIMLANPVRKSAPETFAYFKKQGVAVKVISGDNPMTVSEVALEAGIENAERYVDASTLEDEQLRRAAEEYTVFGRVSPHQKRVLVQALKKAGHTVAMTGDGVNDVLALKDADCSIAMASGSDAAAHSAQMVLLESDFGRMPEVVAEGRRVVNNIERSASLFLVKNIFSLLLSLFTIIFSMKYPLEPSQVSLISMFTIGIPAFVMSMEVNTNQIKGHFLSNVFYRALPAGLTDFAVISSLVVFCREFGVDSKDLSTSSTILLAIVGMMILYRIASPMTKMHWILWGLMGAGMCCSMLFLHQVFAITAISRKCRMLLIVFALVTEPMMRYSRWLIGQIWRGAHWIAQKVRSQKELQEMLFADLSRKE